MPNKRADGQRAQSFSLSELELERLRAEANRLNLPMSALIRQFIATLPEIDHATPSSQIDGRRNPKIVRRRQKPRPD
jgi:hypothetical protein